MGERIIIITYLFAAILGCGSKAAPLPPATSPGSPPAAKAPAANTSDEVMIEWKPGHDYKPPPDAGPDPLADAKVPPRDLKELVKDDGDLIGCVLVRKINIILDSKPDLARKALWDAFANRPYEEQFSDLTTEDSRATVKRYRERIVDLARHGGFDVAGIQRCLDSGPPLDKGSHTAFVPVGAFAAKMGEVDVWIVIYKWEVAGAVDTDGRTAVLGLGHIAMFAFRMSDGKILAQNSCM